MVVEPRLMRYWLIDLPARALDWFGALYLVVLAAGSIVAIVTAVLYLAAVLLGFPQP